jgi:hypothetical protein
MVPDNFLPPDKVSASRPVVFVSHSTAGQQLLVREGDAPTTGVSEESQPSTGPRTTADVIARTKSTEYRRFRTLQQWEGVVTQVREDVFEAELRDLNHPSSPPEFVELSLDEISAPDKPLLRNGSVFYWIIGHETRTAGQILNVSEVRFKRTPRWSRAELEAARKTGKELFERFASHGETSEPRPASCTR